MKTKAYSYKEFLNNIDTVTELHISYNEEIVPSKLKSLTHLHFGYSQFEKLPVWIRDLKKLEGLSIQHSKLTDLPSWLVELSNLKKLEIPNCPLTKIPEVLLNMEQLEELNLDDTQLQSMPKDFALPNLKHISLGYNYKLSNGDVLDALAQLPRLESYELPSSMSLKYSYGKANPDVYYFDRFLRILSKKRKILLEKDHLEHSHMQALYAIFKQDEKELSATKIRLFYELLNCTVNKYREMVLEHLSSTNKGAKTIIKGKKLFVLGKLKVKRADQEDWLAETGAILSKKLTKDIDYVVLGEKPKAKLHEVLKSEIPILIEKDVWDIKDSAYLMDESPQMASNLSNLLQNPSSENVEIALQIMEQGGMPKDIIEEMIGLMLFHSDANLRKRIKIIFDRYLSVELPNATKKLLAKQAYRIKDDKKITAYLQDIVKDTSFDIGRLAYTVYKASNKQQAQGLCLSTPKISNLVIEDYIDKNGRLELKPHKRLANGLHLDRLPAAIEELIQENKITRLEIDKSQNNLSLKLKGDFLRLKGLKRLRLNLGFQRELPDSLFSNTDLEELELSAYSIKKLPKEIGNLQNLKRLDIYVRKVSTFPKEMEALTKIKKISMTMGSSNFPSFIPKSKGLERLYISTPINSLPKEMEMLTKLRYISVKLTKDCSFEDQGRLEKLKELTNKRK
ncbi:MAG: hypothetical protein GY810_00865 [Aureispira sp.]|nr:hypothetical protein [Aureispira sp.]